MNKLKLYLEEVLMEMRKVSRPSQRELVSNTIVTILATIVIGAFIWSVDRVITTMLEVIY